jgi:hypothetical protein
MQTLPYTNKFRLNCILLMLYYSGIIIASYS